MTRWPELLVLAQQVVSRDGAGWPEFWSAVSPHITHWVHSPRFLGRVSGRDDCCRDIVLLTWEKLQERNHHRLHQFFARSGDRDPELQANHFRNWLRLVVKRIGIDYQRSLPEYIRSPETQTDSQDPDQSNSGRHWRAIVSLTTRKGARCDANTARTMARELLDFLDDAVPSLQRRAVILTEQGADSQSVAAALGLASASDAQRVLERARDRMKYRRALEMWSWERSNEEIARALDLRGPDHADRIVRAAKRLLQRHFCDRPSPRA